MKTKKLKLEVGDGVAMHPVPDCYPWPEGLPDHAQVRLIRKVDADWRVEREGREWQVVSVVA